MSDKQNPGSKENDSLPESDEQSREPNESVPKSYYYDDATGYEVYNEEADDEDENKDS
jgi:hypothetical protein